MKDINDKNTPKVYVGTYAKYNNGSIAGAWIDLSEIDDVNEFYDTIKELHKDESDPEYMYQDAENLPPNTYSESGMEWPSLIAYAKLDEEEKELVDAYLGAGGGDITEDILEEAQDRLAYTHDQSYSSNYSSFAEQVGYQMAEDFGDIPEHLRGYIDYEAYGQSYLDDCIEYDGYAFRSY